MRVSNTVASALVLTLATTTSVSLTAAQLFNQLPAMCNHCLTAAVATISPSCNATTLDTTNVPNAMNPTEKACYCALTSTPTSSWTDGCVSLTACTTADITTLANQLSAAKDTGCSSDTTASASQPSGGSSPYSPVVPSSGPPSKNAGALLGAYSKVAVGVFLSVISVAALLL